MELTSFNTAANVSQPKEASELQVFADKKTLSFKKQNVSIEQIKELTLTYPNLEEISLRSATISPEQKLAIAKELSSLPHLIDVDVSRCDFTDEECTELSRSATITKVNVKKCDKITKTGLEKLISLKGLTALNLSRCDGLKDEDFALLKSATSLTELKVRGCGQLEKKKYLGELSDKATAHIAEVPTLRTLNLAHCDQITKLGFETIATKLKLDYLDVSQCENFTGETIKTLVASKDSLKSLKARGCKIVDADIPTFNELSSLEYLSLGHNKALTDNGILALNNPALRTLNIKKCKNITPAAIAQLQEKMKDLKVEA